MDEIFELIKKEEKRQRETLMMIPSENYTYPEVRQAVGSVLMHKYSEGQISARYYQGNEYIDEIERLCKRRALEVFKLDPEIWGVNVQALSGSPANLAIMNALLSLSDTILSMYLYDGGHLSHGWSYQDRKITMSSKIWKIEFYKVDAASGRLDYDEILEKAREVKPKMLVSGGTGYSPEIDHKKMGEIAKEVGAFYLADVSHEAGLIAGGANVSPFPFADVVMMTTHKTLRGPRGALIFYKKDLKNGIDSSVFPGLQGGPHNHTIAGIAIALEKAKTQEFQKYSEQIVKNAKVLAHELKNLGYTVVSEGTEKHLMLIDLRPQKINGWFVAWALEYAGIVCNRSTVPNDSASPYYPSGIRLGTPALTTRGMKEQEMKIIAGLIDKVIEYLGEREIPEDKEERSKFLREFKLKFSEDKFLKKIRQEVKDLCSKFPVDF